MRALVLAGRGFEHLSVTTVLTPRPKAKQLLARVDAAGICTSLIKLIEQGADHSYLYGWTPAEHPLILGDEGAVTLAEIGSDLSERYKVGERFVIQPAVDHPPVNHLERYQDNGAGIFKLGVGYSLAGHLAEYILISEEILEAGCLIPLPQADLPHAHAALSEPISCVIASQDHHLHLNQASPFAARTVAKGLKRGGTTVIVGAGAMGRMHVDAALAHCPKHIVVSDFIAERLEKTRRLFAAKAKRLGVQLHTLDGASDVHAYLQKLTEHKGADDVIVAVGAARAVEAAQHYVGRGGVLNLFGGMKKGSETVALEGNLIHYKEISVTGSSGGSPWDMIHTLDLMTSDALEASAHITRVGDLEHAPAFLEMVKRQALDGKAVVYPHRRSAEMLSVDTWTATDEQSYLA